MLLAQLFRTIIERGELTRDYMAGWEQAHPPAEEASSRRLKLLN